MLGRTSLQHLPRSVLLATALVFASASAHSQVNGSFESPNIVGTGSYALYGPGSTLITGWTVADGGDVQLTSDTFMALNASNGRQWVDLTGIYGYDKGIYSDLIPVTEGAVYHLSLDVGNYIPFGMSTLEVTVNGKASHLFTNTSLAGNSPMTWQSFAFDWTAETTFARIEIFGRENGTFSNNGAIGVDNVSLTAAVSDNLSLTAAVPEPETYLLMVGGFGAIGFIARRRKPGQARRIDA
jgi:hypothetical protein